MSARKARGGPRELGKRVVRGVARRLPGDQGAALIDAARAGYAALTGRRTGPGSFTREALAALQAIQPGTREPLLLGYYPRFQTNPYQSLLYREARALGIAPIGIRRVEAIGELTELQRAGIPTVLHVHWLHLVLGEAATPGDARAAAARFLDLLDQHAAAGGKLVWTVHNILPHESRFEDADAALSAEVARRADVVHVLAAATPDLVAPYFELPRDRVLHVPHPSYAGAYDDTVSRPDARGELGLEPDDIVYLVIGAIRAYKGLEELLQAWQMLSPNPHRRLLIAGAPADDERVRALLERAATLPNVVVDARKIPADEMQLFLRAADIAVLPYRRALNSGALLLALTFGLPVVVPEASGLAELVDDAFAVTFDPTQPASLATALAAAERLATREASAAASATAARFEPDTLSRQFATALRERLGMVR